MNKKIVKNSLGYDNNLYVYQDKDMFNYSVDTILLANLVSLNSKTKYFLEIGANNGALSIFLASRWNKITIDAVEIQTNAIELAKKNVKLNKLENQINLIEQDFNLFWKEHNKNQLKKYDVIICNPPFYKLKYNKTKQKLNNSMLIATHEIKLNLEQIIKGSSKIINQKGNLALIIPPERLVDCCVLMRQEGFEPKRIKFIQPRPFQKPNLVFIEARYRSGWGTIVEKPIFLHPNDLKKHEYTKEVLKLYKPLKMEEKNNNAK